MRFLLGGSPSYADWTAYFDWIVVGSAKPGFFVDGRPFQELDRKGAMVGTPRTDVQRGKIYQGGNLQAFQRLTQHAGEKVLYVGDHIYGDILKSKKTSLWRTCMVVQEIEDELNYTFERSEEITKLSAMEILRARVDDEIGKHKGLLNSLERRLEREKIEGPSKQVLEEERKRVKAELDRLRKACLLYTSRCV